MMDLPETDSEDEIPPGWEERVTTDGSVFYVNHGLKSTQWTHPRTGKKKFVSGNLPFGWEKCVDENTGKIFFVDHENKRTTYTDPRLAFATEEKEHPYDLRQKFDASSTALQILHGKDLSGQVALVTGANTGIGFETARSLARHGCKVIFACRNMDAADEAIKRIADEKADAAKNCDCMRLNLASFADVRSFAEGVIEKYKRIDMLILNAGVFGMDYSTTRDGYETTFQVNHLSHYYLTRLLSKLLGKNSRVIILSSESHRFANLDINNISPETLSPLETQYWSMMAYNNSKLCNILFANELSRLWEGRAISVFVVHPGNMISTDLSRHWWGWKLLFLIVRPFTKSLQQGASTTVYCATARELSGLTGLYFNNCHICNVSDNAKSSELAKRLWDISADMIKAKIGPEACLQ
ncbi:WW domain-containing oxidoreductase [Chrysoperla carnea]|uniref:WW domain-containing oxidoreductase n=1 Tax=Chrysoperla carnea TaxID=189513 RepID=UPI001D08EB02|nr:WW domain-containing oxidoreductase [Chrysoperla carnea]